MTKFDFYHAIIAFDKPDDRRYDALWTADRIVSMGINIHERLRVMHHMITRGHRFDFTHEPNQIMISKANGTFETFNWDVLDHESNYRT